MHNDKYYRSKIPLRLVLMFLVNLFLVMAVEILAIYKYPAQLDKSTLAKYDSCYSGCTILSTDSVGKLSCYLVETETGEIHLVTTRIHGIFFSRADIVDVQTVDAAQTTLSVKIGIRTSEISVTGQTVSIRFANLANYKNIASYYIALTAVLEAAELLVVYFIKRDP